MLLFRINAIQNERKRLTPNVQKTPKKKKSVHTYLDFFLFLLGKYVPTARAKVTMCTIAFKSKEPSHKLSIASSQTGNANGSRHEKG
jgi:hypothetical protein